MIDNQYANILKTIICYNDNIMEHMYFGYGSLKSSNLTIEVKDIGKIDFPLTKEVILKLIDRSEKAKFGYKDQTLLDESVRSTHEIKADQLGVNFTSESLDKLFNNIKTKLGMDDDVNISLHLHNMLIYEKDQFFNSHKDTEKLDNMVATLVVVLPSPHIGGDLIIELDNQKSIFSTENVDEKNIKYAVFYADCDHNVKKVTSGYRVVLTFNVVLDKNKTNKDENNIKNKEFIDSIKYYFSNSKNEKFIFLLNHCYSEHGLHWDLLKGSDRLIGHDLLLSSKELDCHVYLSLLEIQETWNDSNCDEDNPDLTELLNDSITFIHWVDENDETKTIAHFKASKQDMCTLKENDLYKPFDQEHEGYMGNYGGTMDLWYKRAAIVMWPKSLSLSFEFRYNHKHALHELVKKTAHPGLEDEVRSIIKSVGNDLFQYRGITSENFMDYATLAIYVKDEDIATFIINSLNWFDLNRDTAKRFADLLKNYTMLDIIVDRMLNSESHHYNNQRIFENFLSLINIFVEEEIDNSIIKKFLNHQFNEIKKKDRSTEKESEKSIRSNRKLHEKMVEDLVISFSNINENPSLIIDHILSIPNIYDESSLIKIYQKIQHYLKADIALFFKNNINSRVSIIIENGEPTEDDFSIDEKMPCTCSHCKEVSFFLKNKTQKELIMSIVQADRYHVSRILNHLCAPLKTEELKKGSPYKLIITKTRSLYKEKKEFYDLFLEFLNKNH